MAAEMRLLGTFLGALQPLGRSEATGGAAAGGGVQEDELVAFPNPCSGLMVGNA